MKKLAAWGYSVGVGMGVGCGSRAGVVTSIEKQSAGVSREPLTGVTRNTDLLDPCTDKPIALQAVLRTVG